MGTSRVPPCPPPPPQHPWGGRPQSVAVSPLLSPVPPPPPGGTHPSALLARLAPGARLALKHRKGRAWRGGARGGAAAREGPILPRTCVPSCPRLPGGPWGPWMGWGERACQHPQGAQPDTPHALPQLRPPQLVSQGRAGGQLTLSPFSPGGPAAPGAPALPCTRTRWGLSAVGRGPGGLCGTLPPPHPSAPTTYVGSWGAGWPNGTWGAGGTCKERGHSSAQPCQGAPRQGTPKVLGGGGEAV